VPGFITTGDPGLSATGPQWGAVRSLDGHRFALKVLPVADAAEACALATRQMAEYDRIENEHLVRQHHAISLADGTLALVLDEVTGGSLAQLIGARGQLTAGETVTTVAPLFGALADLHAAGVVHGDLAPGNVIFSADGRPMIGDLGVARLLGRQAGRGDGNSGFEAPELSAGAEPSPVCDVYAMAALGWFCLTGAPPAPAARRPDLTALRPGTPPRLVGVLTACLATDPAARPSAREAAVEVFDATPAESVALASVCDPAAEITRRIRAAVVSPGDPAPPPTGRSFQAPVIIGVVALLVSATLFAGATWFQRRQQGAPRPVAALSVAQPGRSPGKATSTTLPTVPSTPARTPATTRTPTPTTLPTSMPKKIASRKVSRSPSEVVTASNSPRVAAAGLLQALVDARALAYVSRSSALLDLVYAPGAAQSEADRDNIATALANGGTYLGLSYVIKDVAFLDGASDRARIRATILTPPYKTGQPDGSKIPHTQEILGPCIFSLSLTPDGWRILGLTGP
jgi:serine/threonine protein kinase